MENNISISGSINVTGASNVSIGNIASSKSLSTSKSSDISEILILAKLLLEDKNIPQDKKAELDSAIHCIEVLDVDNPNSKKSLTEVLHTIKNIAEGIVGSVLATGLLAVLSKFV